MSRLKNIFNRKNNISIIAGEPKRAVMFLFWPLLLSYTVVAINGYLDSFGYPYWERKRPVLSMR